MSNPEEGWRVAIGPTEWVTVSTPGEAVALGRHLATLVAAIGVERAERERLAAEIERLRKHRITLIERLDKAIEDINNVAAENERLRKAGDEMADTLNSTYTKEVKEMNLCQWAAAKKGRDAK